MTRDRFDVAVVGAGVMGASIAFHVAARGASVVLLDRGAVCSGSTRHSTAVIRTHYTQPLLVRMAAHGLQVYRAFEDVVGARSGFVRTGMLWGADPVDRAMLEANVALGKAEGVATDVVGADEVAEIDARIVADDLVFCWEPEAGVCDPYAVTAGFAAEARRLGADVREGVAAVRVEPGGVATAGGFVAAGAVVVAAGPWTPALLAPRGYDLDIRPARAQVGRLRLPDDFGPPPPTVGDFSAAQLYFRPGEAGFLDVGSLDPRHADEPVDPDGVAEGAERGVLAHYHRSVRRRLRGADRGVWRGAWSGIYDVTADWEPVIGRVPGADGLFVAAGFSGHGFKLAPAVGVSVAELALDGAASSFDVSLLDPLRFDRGELVGARYGYSVLG